DRGCRRTLERRAPGRRDVAVEDDHDGRRRRGELRLEDGLRPRRFEVVEDEPAGSQRTDDPRREGQRDEKQDRPGRDDRPPSADNKSTEPRESIGGSLARGASRWGRRHDDRNARWPARTPRARGPLLASRCRYASRSEAFGAALHDLLLATDRVR